LTLFYATPKAKNISFYHITLAMLFHIFFLNQQFFLEFIHVLKPLYGASFMLNSQRNIQSYQEARNLLPSFRCHMKMMICQWLFASPFIQVNSHFSIQSSSLAKARKFVLKPSNLIVGINFIMRSELTENHSFKWAKST